MCVDFSLVHSISCFGHRFFIRVKGANKTPLYGFWFFHTLYCTMVRKRLEGWLGRLPEATADVDKFLDAKIEL